MSERKEQATGAKMDLRIRRTRSAIREAFVALMQNKEYAAITVTDISERAGINRKTFYAHYDSVDDLLRGRSYEEMLRNGRVHDTDGFLTDGENSVTEW